MSLLQSFTQAFYHISKYNTELPSALTAFDTSDEELLFNYSFKSSLISHLLIAVALHLTKAEVCCFGEVTEVSICKLKPKKNILRK